MNRENFITPDALESRLGKPGLSIVCNFMYLPGDERDGSAEFEQSRIPGSVFFDIDKIADQTSNLPHMVANPEQLNITRLLGKWSPSDYSTFGVFALAASRCRMLLQETSLPKAAR